MCFGPPAPRNYSANSSSRVCPPSPCPPPRPLSSGRDVGGPVSLTATSHTQPWSSSSFLCLSLYLLVSDVVGGTGVTIGPCIYEAGVRRGRETRMVPRVPDLGWSPGSRFRDFSTLDVSTHRDTSLLGSPVRPLGPCLHVLTSVVSSRPEGTLRLGPLLCPTDPSVPRTPHLTPPFTSGPSTLFPWSPPV